VAKLVGLVVERERLFEQREEARARVLALQNTNQRLNEFLGVASHELKTPVTSLKVNVQLGARWLAKLSRRAAEVNERFADEVEPVRELLERSDRTMVRLTRLVDDLLDVSRIRAGRLELRCEPCDLVAIVRDVVAQERAVVAEEGSARTISLALPQAASIPLVADADRIEQVVTNYLTNALKYSPSDAPVEVRLEVLAGSAGEMARVSVCDCGPGLPIEEREQIWEPFHRAQGIDVLSGSGVGLGLGLYISRTIIERHGGAVGVESAPGAGSTFWFELPLAPEGV
jgi:signal transduction histidine kinase